MSLSSSGQHIVRRIFLTEGSPVVFPSNSHIVHSEVVVDEEDTEVLQVWLAVPLVSTADTSVSKSTSNKVIYSNTVIYEEDEDADESYNEFLTEVNQAVDHNMKDYIPGDDDEYYS